MRNEQIEEFRTSTLPKEELIPKYFGLETVAGVTDARFKSYVEAICSQTDDCIFFSHQLANDLVLNDKTVAKAYQLLARDSIIETKGYRGTYVHPKAKANCKFDLQAWTLGKLSEAIDELREAGVTDSEIRNAFAGAINRLPPVK